MEADSLSRDVVFARQFATTAAPSEPLFSTWSALTCLLAMLVASCMVWPVVTMAVAGITLTGMAEESVGYRYFYTLRILYADHERPWLPQGQLAGFTHLGIQLVLTLAGYPPEQLFPRIDLFAYLASALPSLLTAVAFAYAVWPLRDARPQLVVGLLLLVVVFDGQSGRGLHLIQADYYTWVHPVALVTIGMMLRVVNQGCPLDSRSGLGVGLFAAAAFTIKPTHLIFVAPVALLMLAQAVGARRWLGAVLGSLVALGSSALGVVTITCVYYLGDVSATYEYFFRLASFIDSVSTTAPFVEWLITALRSPQRLVNPLTLGVLLVPVLAFSLLALPNRTVSFALLPGALASVYFSWRRYYPNTLVETNDYTFMILVVWGALVVVPAIAPRLRQLPSSSYEHIRRRATPLSVVGFVVALLLGLRLAEDIPAARETMLTSFGSSSIGARDLSAYLASRPGRVAFFIPDGNRRPTTVDSAIAKGGTNISDTTWGVSPYVASLFPERDYFIGTPTGGPEVNVSAYDRIVFVSVPAFGGDADATKQLWDHFRVSLTGMDCGFRVDLRHHEVVVCERSWHLLTPDEAHTALYYASDVAPAVGGSTDIAPGISRRLAVSDLVYWRGQGLWQIQENGSVAAVRSFEGNSLVIEGVGAWDPLTGDLSGLIAVYSDGRWTIDPSQLLPSNVNPTFLSAGSPGLPLPGWELAPSDRAPSVEHLSDDAGPFVRLRPSAQGISAILYTSHPLSQLDGAPVLLRARVRAHGATPATLTLYDVPQAPGRALTQTRSTSSFDTWETLEVRLDYASFPYPEDNFSLAIFGAAEGDWFDVRELSLLVGVLP